MPASRVRAVVPDGFLVGRSVHSREEAETAEADGGCDYLIFGTVFPSNSKPQGQAAAGVDLLREVCRTVRLPVVAIGGMNEARAAEAARAGARGVAGIEMFAGADEGALAAAVAQMRRAFD
jgi:thiamine-phosphate pyrophosphorylase